MRLFSIWRLYTLHGRSGEVVVPVSFLLQKRYILAAADYYSHSTKCPASVYKPPTTNVLLISHSGGKFNGGILKLKLFMFMNS